MKRQARLNANKIQRAERTRAKITGTPERPRLSVFVSNTHVSVQVIDDTKSATLASATTVGTKTTGTMTEKAASIGTKIAEICKKQKISKVVMDRGNKKYHGRVKALADAARAEGLEF